MICSTKDFNLDINELSQDYLRRFPLRDDRYRRDRKVCKHWLRALCKKDDKCQFLHEYDLEKMPECTFYKDNGQCTNDDCMFVHLDYKEQLTECPWYVWGFC